MANLDKDQDLIHDDHEAKEPPTQDGALENKENEAEEDIDVEPTGIAKTWADMKFSTKMALEIIAGVVLAAACGFFLFRSGQNSDNMWALFAAAGIALLFPRMLETQLNAKLMWMRRMMLIGLVIIIIIMVVFAVQSGGMFAS